MRGNTLGQIGVGVELAREREIASIIAFARDLRGESSRVANRLYEIRARLLGLNGPQGTEAPPAVKEVVNSELVDLRTTLEGVAEQLNQANSYLSDLEGV